MSHPAYFVPNANPNLKLVAPVYIGDKVVEITKVPIIAWFLQDHSGESGILLSAFPVSSDNLHFDGECRPEYIIFDALSNDWYTTTGVYDSGIESLIRFLNDDGKGKF